MRKLRGGFALALLVVALLATVLTVPASAELQRVTVQLADGTLDSVILDLPPGTTIADLEGRTDIIGTPISIGPVDTGTPAPNPPPDSTPTNPPPVDPGTPAPAPGTPAPSPEQGGNSGSGSSPNGTHAPRPVPLGDETTVESNRPKRGDPSHSLTLQVDPRDQALTSQRRKGRRAPLRRGDGSPTSFNPGFMDVLPGPSSATGVPNFIIDKFRVPPFLLPVYQAAGTEYGVRWEILAAINEIESDYGRNLNVSSAGALGWMQFLPSTWRTYGVDGNGDGRKDPYNPVDAIFAAARYLKAAGYQDDVRRAIFSYNHADWYVDSVLLRARLIAGVPVDLIGSLTGLTEGRFPVAARAQYADDLAEQQLLKRVGRGENAANLIEGSASRRSIDIFTRRNAPVVAVNDGVIRRIGKSAALGRYVVLEDVYGNQYTYARLGRVPAVYPVPKETPAGAVTSAPRPSDAPPPQAPASAGTQVAPEQPQASTARGHETSPRRLFAHPSNGLARRAGGLEQQLAEEVKKNGKIVTYRNYFSRPFGADPSNVELRPLRAGARVIAGTIIGRVAGARGGTAPHHDFAIRPAGRGAPQIDPKPILDGWKLLEATAIYRMNGENALRDGPTVGQIMLLSKALLEKRVLADRRIDIYACGRNDILAGQIDRRVLVTLEYLAESGLNPTVSALRCGHGYFTKSGNVSEHSSGNAVDISRINGIPVLGHQEEGSVVDQAVRRVAQLQGAFAPHQVISLFSIGGATLSMPDHADHIHVGFAPVAGGAGSGENSVLKPDQWPRLLARLGKIRNPVVEAPGQ